MTRDDEFIGHLEDYLDEFEGMTPLPDAVRDAIRAELRTTRQITTTGPTRYVSMGTNISVTVRYALVAAAAVIVAVIGINLLVGRGGVGGPTASGSPLPSGSSQASPVPSSETDAFLGGYKLGRHAVTVDGVSFSFNIETTGRQFDVSGWEPYPDEPLGSIHLSKSIQGPQGAEAVIYWARYPDGAEAHPCGSLADPTLPTSAADVASVLAAAPGTELVTAPEDVTVGGHPAKHLVVRVHSLVGCNPGFFYTWKAKVMGALWTETRVGDIIRVWVVDVNGVLLFIGGETTTDTSVGQISQEKEATLDGEIQRIVDSIRLE
jgi:hypothetical protein